MKFGSKDRKLLLTALLCVLCYTHGALAASDSPKQLFEEARSEYRRLLGTLPGSQQPEDWKRCIDKLKRVREKQHHGEYGEKSLYLIGQSYHHLYDNHHRAEDLKAAVSAYRELVYQHPNSPLSDDAQYLIGILVMEEDPAQAYLEFTKVIVFFPKGDMFGKASQRAQELMKRFGCQDADKAAPEQEPKAAPVASVPTTTPETALEQGAHQDPAGFQQTADTQGDAGRTCPKLVQLGDIQHWSGENYTRVVLYLSGPMTYQKHHLGAEPQVGLPARIYLDLQNCALNRKLKPKIPIGDRFLRRVRVAQYDQTRARVVLDIESMESHKVFSLADPDRLIIDVRGKKPAAQAEKKESVRVAKEKRKARPEISSLARQLGLDVKRIVLDPGHGGKDKGAIGPNQIYEKEVTLAVAKELKKVLEDKTGCEVILTRTKDQFLSLEERTAIANAQNADLFISIHTNAHENKDLFGTETYFLNLSKDKESARVAALENSTSTKRISDLEAILQDLMRNTKLDESQQLAGEVQKHLITALKSTYNDIRDLGVKQAPFHVLLGAEMPSILIELAFITNEREEGRLQDTAFRRSLAAGIATGVGSYIQQIRKLARVGEPS